jgi:hypothetical protein
MAGSGEVPQDELAPWLEFEEAGELYVVLCPVLIFPLAESVLDLEPFETVLVLAKKSNGGVLPTLSRMEGLKSPERLDMSPPSSWPGVCAKLTVEPWVAGYCND